VLLSIAGPSNMTLHEINTAATMIAEHSDGDANIIFGAVIDDTLGDEMRVTVIAAGFDRDRRTTRLSESTSPTLPPLRRPSLLEDEEEEEGGGDDLDIPGFVQG
jgi:cell division protein FtsZ